MKYFTKVGDDQREYRFVRRGDVIEAHCGGDVFSIDLSMTGDGVAFSMLVDGVSHDCICERDGDDTLVMIAGQRIRVLVEDERERAAHQVAAARPKGPMQVEATMPGIVVSLAVEVGESVTAGQTLLIIEAMKMQNPIQADGPGEVMEILAVPGEAVAAGALLMKIEAGE
jgi:biotin carboxyl carrier protein